MGQKEPFKISLKCLVSVMEIKFRQGKYFHLELIEPKTVGGKVENSINHQNEVTLFL